MQRRLLLTALLFGAAPLFLPVPSGAELPESAEVRPLRVLSRATPPLPDPGVFPVQLVLDDDSADSVVAFDGSAARQFLWLNRFQTPGPFDLQEIWVLFPPGDAAVGAAVQLVVYSDGDADPSNGAALVATYDVMVQAADGNTFSVYSLPAPLFLDAADSVLIGVVNRWFQTGFDPPPTAPAAFDANVSQNRSYLALWSGDPPSDPFLETAIDVSLLDGAVTGNFMIRGFGVPQLDSTIEIPTLSTGSLALLALLVGFVAVSRIRRRPSLPT